MLTVASTRRLKPVGNSLDNRKQVVWWNGNDDSVPFVLYYSFNQAASLYLCVLALATPCCAHPLRAQRSPTTSNRRQKRNFCPKCKKNLPPAWVKLARFKAPVVLMSSRSNEASNPEAHARVVDARTVEVENFIQAATEIMPLSPLEGILMPSAAAEELVAHCERETISWGWEAAANPQVSAQDFQ